MRTIAANIATLAGLGEAARIAAGDVQSVVIPGSGHHCLEEAPRRYWRR